jgi:hypothetical protein
MLTTGMRAGKATMQGPEGDSASPIVAAVSKRGSRVTVVTVNGDVKGLGLGLGLVWLEL